MTIHIEYLNYSLDDHNKTDTVSLMMNKVYSRS